ncbi:Uncharacterised protein [Vibrio cholerae]|nr:Uncharacterised protein [Vibrio cholerae]
MPKKASKSISGLCKLKRTFGISARVTSALPSKLRALAVSLLSSTLRWFCVKSKAICESKLNFIGDCGNAAPWLYQTQKYRVSVWLNRFGYSDH